MPKRQTKSASQPTLFRRDILQMPDGYYSSEPNPNLHNFVEDTSTPYDSAKDEYSVDDFSAELIGNRHSAEYNFLGYSSKKPYEPIQKYIDHFSKPDDLILDPFCGSGGVGFVCTCINRKVILIDASPLATAISAAYVTPIEISELEAAFLQLESQLKVHIANLYGTKCHLCDGKAEVLTVVHSQSYRCSKCFEIILLADCGDNKCLHCGEPVSNRQKRLGQYPWMSEIKCLEGCKGKLRRTYNDKNHKAREYFKLDVKDPQISELGKSLQSIRMMNFDGKGQQWGLLWRPYHDDIQTPADFFTHRNLKSILTIKSTIEKLQTANNVKRLLNLGLANIIPSASRQQRYYPGSTFPNMAMPGMLYVPPVNEEINVFKRFLSKKKTLFRGLESINRKILHTNVLISTQSALDLSQIPDNSIDYVFTDPPYSGRIQYGELNFLEEAVLGFDTGWLTDEVIVNEFRGFNIEEWASRLKQAMQETFRILKPGRWLSVCYHDSEITSWLKLQDLMLEIGFIPGGAEGLSSIETGWQTLKMHTSTDITKRDLVINFKKPTPKELLQGVIISGEEDSTTFSEKASLILREALERHPGASADRLYDELVSRMVRKGQFQRHNFDELLRGIAEETGGRWYLLDTADKLDETEAKIESIVAARLETFMQTYLKKHPDEDGVHYSNLFEEYLPISDKPRRLIQDWLPEFFYKTEDGTWRPPANEDERQLKLALRLSGELRHIKRFANALSADVPPAEHDRPGNAATLADWIYQCRRAGLYEMGRVLYERGGLRFDSLTEERQLQVEEDYQICVKRGSVNEKKSSRKKKKQPETV